MEGKRRIRLVSIIDGKGKPTSVPTLTISPGQTESFGPNTTLLAVTDVVPAGEHTVGIGVIGIGQFNGQALSLGGKQIFRVD